MTQQINLYETRLRPRHELVTARNLGVATLLALVLMTALALWTGTEARRTVQQAEVVQDQLVSTQSQLTELGKAVEARTVSPALTAEINVVKSRLAVQEEVLTVLGSGPLGNSSGFSTVMTGFAHRTQSDLWLIGFDLTAGGENLEIRGRLLDPAKLPAYVQHLRDEPVFQGRRFAALEMHAGREEDRSVTEAPTPRGATADGLVSSPVLLPRFVEFVLRSEKMATGDVATGASR